MELKKIMTVFLAAVVGGAASIGLSKAFDKEKNYTFEEKQRAYFASLPASKLSEKFSKKLEFKRLPLGLYSSYPYFTLYV